MHTYTCTPHTCTFNNRGELNEYTNFNSEATRNTSVMLIMLTCIICIVRLQQTLRTKRTFIFKWYFLLFKGNRPSRILSQLAIASLQGIKTILFPCFIHSLVDSVHLVNIKWKSILLCSAINVMRQLRCLKNLHSFFQQVFNVVDFV